jgi:hypothetical protein
MNDSFDIYVYKMTTDNGGAPCVYRGVLSLAICKPIIRKVAKVGSLIFGFGGQRLKNRLIYAAYVTEKPAVGDYYHDSRFYNRPDCIYRERDGKPERIANARFHADSDQSETDVGKSFERAHVLLSKNFRYFGETGTREHETRYAALAKMLARLRRYHRINHPPDVQKELLELAKLLWQCPAGNHGKPSDADNSRRCNK